MDRYAWRAQDFSLTDDQEQIAETYRSILASHCSIDIVRAAGPRGFDAGLWDRLWRNGATDMALSEERGGGADLADLVVVAEELGRAAAPVPLIDHWVATRLLDRALGDATPEPEVPSGPVGFHVNPGSVQLVAGGSAARQAVVLAEAGLEYWVVDESVAGRTPLEAFAPAAVWARPERCRAIMPHPEARQVHTVARSDWKVLTASYLIGMLAACLEDAVEFAKTRHTRGVPVGSLQGVSHPLADVAVTVATGRNLVRKAAWMHEREPSARPDLPLSAYVFAARHVLRGLETAIRVQGGLGFTLESNVSAYFLKARGLVAIGGDPGLDAIEVARLLGASGREIAG